MGCEGNEAEVAAGSPLTPSFPREPRDLADPPDAWKEEVEARSKTLGDFVTKPEGELEHLRKQVSAKDLMINLLQQRLQSSPPAAPIQAPWSDGPNAGWQGPTMPPRSTLSEVCAAAQAARKQAQEQNPRSVRVAWHDEIAEECYTNEKSMEDELLAMQHRLETQEKEAGDLRGGMSHLECLMAEKDREIKKMQMLLGELQATMTPRSSMPDSVSQSISHSAVTATFGTEDANHSSHGGERSLHDKLRWLEQQIHGRPRSSGVQEVNVRTIDSNRQESQPWAATRSQTPRSSCQPFAPEGRNPGTGPRRTKPHGGHEKASLAAWISGSSATASTLGPSPEVLTPRVREALPKRAASSAVPAAECRPLPEHRINYGQTVKATPSSFSGPSAKPTVKPCMTVEGTVTYRAAEVPLLSGSGRTVRSHSSRVRVESPSKVTRCMTRSDSQPRTTHPTARSVHVESLTPRRSVEVKPPFGWTSVAGSCSTPNPGPSVITATPVPSSPRRSAIATPTMLVGADAASAATAAAAFARASAPLSARVVSSTSARRHVSNRSLSPAKGGSSSHRPASPRPITPVPSQQVVSAKQITVKPGFAYGAPAPSYCVGTSTPMRPTTSTYSTPRAPTPPPSATVSAAAPWSTRWS
mmetsp:Transcript_48122/g.112523  ORF Transcript_48122/g.112523 Transcript_48122/m.112523 type:complete len:641 (-) Transcript_48122:119-2041(-)